MQVTQAAVALKGKVLCDMPCLGVQANVVDPLNGGSTIEVSEDGRLPSGEMGTGIRSTGQVSLHTK